MGRGAIDYKLSKRFTKLLVLDSKFDGTKSVTSSSVDKPSPIGASFSHTLTGIADVQIAHQMQM